MPMHSDDLILRQQEDLLVRVRELLAKANDSRTPRISHVGTIIETVHTDQRVDLYLVQLGEDSDPYAFVTATYIHNFWHDAEGRGELADVIVLNGVDGYTAVDPAEAMFPPAT